MFPPTAHPLWQSAAHRPRTAAADLACGPGNANVASWAWPRSGDAPVLSRSRIPSPNSRPGPAAGSHFGRQSATNPSPDAQVMADTIRHTRKWFAPAPQAAQNGVVTTSEKGRAECDRSFLRLAPLASWYLPGVNPHRRNGLSAARWPEPSSPMPPAAAKPAAPLSALSRAVYLAASPDCRLAATVAIPASDGPTASRPTAAPQPVRVPVAMRHGDVFTCPAVTSVRNQTTASAWPTLRPTLRPIPRKDPQCSRKS